MKTYSKFFASSILMLLISGSALAQKDFQGKAYYFSKTTLDMENFGGREMSDQQKKQIAERMKGMFEKTFILTFNKEESIYKEEEKLEAPGGGGMRFGGMSMGGGDQYKNVKENKMMVENEFFGKQFLVNDELQKLEWVMTAETKQIGQYLAMKATAVKKLDDTDFMSARRRNRGSENEDKAKDSTKTDNPMDEIEIPKEQTITAWYTPQIPINQGPGEYWGLPGLILEVSAGNTVILCSKIVMNPGEKEEIKMPSKGKEVTQAEYSEIVKKKMEEMSEMFRGRGGRDGGGRRNN
ncbi:MAG: GLPGLI family protein [Bacteroidetes bacterium]|nr:MAG: GLPGLI family protein [Bacteroidota bacterium]